MHLAKIKDLEAQIEALTETATTATAAAEKNAASEAEWRAKLEHYSRLETEEANSQRSKLVEDLQSEITLWRRKFDELLEEHSALQTRLENTTAQVNLLDKALTTVRDDTVDAVAALATAESLLAKKIEEFEAYKTQKDTFAAEVASAAAEKERKIVALTLENQNLSQQVDSLNRKVEELTSIIEKKDLEKATITLQEAPSSSSRKELESGGGGHKLFLKEIDINAATKSANATTAEKVIKEKNTTFSTSQPALISTQKKERLSPSVAAQTAAQERQPPLPFQRQGPCPPPPSHFDAAKALIARTAELEDSLMNFNIERSALETELAKFPNGTAGKTVAERKRKKEIEQRVEVLNKAISGVRLELRKLGIR
jgi:DNA repair exonuclease SbcCD ATPase subunit